MQTDHEVETPVSQQPRRAAISASYTCVTDFSLDLHLYVVDCDSMVLGPSNHSEGSLTLTRQHQLRCLHWNWQYIFFSDESKFQLFRADGSSVLCSGDCTVWWWICDDLGRYLWPTADGNLTAHRYINQVVCPVLLPFLQHKPRLFVSTGQWQTSHSLCGTTVLCCNQRQCVDLSPIEHLWDHLGQRIWCRPNPPVYWYQLVQALRQEWRAIPDAIIKHLTNSVRCWVHACILAIETCSLWSNVFTFVMSCLIWNHTFHP